MADTHHGAQGAHHTAHHVSDTRAAFTGLVVGAIIIFVCVVGVVKLTNAHYAKEKPAAGAPQH